MRTKRALVCAPKLPEFDREGGSRRVFHLVEFLRAAGWAVSFLAQNAAGGERYVRALQQMGVATYASDVPWSLGPDCLVRPEQLISTEDFDLILVAFWHYAEALIPLVRAQSPRTKIVVDSIDLHFLRQSRSVFVRRGEDGGQPALDANYAAEMMRELNVYASADAVLTVSDKEAKLINDFTSDPQLALSVPDTEDVPLSPVPLAERRGMLFVGNYRHPPNAQAVEYLCEEVLPFLDQEMLEEHPLYVVGNDLSETVVGYGRGLKNIKWVGWVPTVIPYLHRARVSLIPLLYGAGTKRKLMQSIMAGTPGVSTGIGVEGLMLEDGEHVLVADGPEAFARSVTRLLTDDALWQRLAERGREQVLAAHGREAVGARFESVLSEIMDRPMRWAALASSAAR